MKKYSTNKIQVSYFVELPQSNFPYYTNSPTFGLITDLSRIPRHFQVSRNSGKVVTLYTIVAGQIKARSGR